MRKRNLFFNVLLAILIVAGTGCKKSKLSTKSSTVEMKATSGTMPKSTSADFPVLNGTASLASVNVTIANLQIEENSGNDGENVEDNNDGGNETDNGDNNNDGGNETDNGDIILSGPYSFDVSSGIASIDQVDIYPGTFKKVDFDFKTSSDVPFVGNSIVIKGIYTDGTGNSIPFTINSAYAGQVQVPLANGGVTVSANSKVGISIVFDVKTWLSFIDFNSATHTNNEILIDGVNNVSLLKVFEANLSVNAEQED